MRALLFALLLGLLAVPADAQTIWSRPYQANQLAVEAIVPDTPDDASALTGATFLTGTLSLNDNLEVAAELPMARYGATADGVSSTTAVGNPYVGLGFSSTTIPVLVQIGARIPVAPTNAAARIGTAADLGRLSAFRPEEFVLSGLLNGRRDIGRNTTLRVRTGLGYASFERPTPQDRKREWRAYYDAQIWREGDRFITGVSITGRATLTKPRRTQHHAVLSLMGNWRRVQPGLMVGTALNDLVQDGTLTPVAGITLSVTYLR
jgi:hypothetical protein